MRELTLAFVGAGGDGAVAIGDIVASACASKGLHVLKTEAYGPQIRGGESSSTVRVSSEPIHAQADAVDVLVVFSWADFARFRDEITLADHAVIFHEAADEPPSTIGSRSCYPVRFTALTREAGAAGAKNVLAAGLIGAALGLPLDAIRGAISKRFAKKAPAVIENNLRVFDRGVLEAKNLAVRAENLEYEWGSPKLMMSGNEATAFAAIHAGCRFFAGYPITPSSEVLHFLGEWLPKLGGSTLQTEDELSAIGAVIGASFAGKKAMTATSGPGLSLMAELLGLASIAELPLVIANVQRGGPSTGLPTKSEQSDLLHALFASHGDTPRVVIACSDVAESFHATVDAFNIAEEYQLPVILLTDQSIAQRRQTIDEASLQHPVRERLLVTGDDLGENYLRYRDTSNGISPMSAPGMTGGIYQTNGLEHDEDGRPSQSFQVHEKMNEKRYRKVAAVAERYRLFHRFGAEKPEVGILCWGSSVGVVREALQKMGSAAEGVGVFAPIMLAPLPQKDMQAFVDSCKSLLVVELSFSGQFHQYLRSQLDLPRKDTHVFSRSGGKALSTIEIINALQPILTANLMEVLA
jgi:2-oxoglutarate ferredoxin oxidoreductase subunit alpha